MFRLATNVMEVNTSFLETIALEGCTQRFRQGSGGVTTARKNEEAEDIQDDTDSTREKGALR